MNRKGLLLAVVALSLLAVAPVGVVGDSGGAAGNATNSTAGDYTIGDLRDGGTEIENGPDSQRFLGDYGSATVRYIPVGPLKGEDAWEYLEPGTELHSDEVTLRTVRLAPEEELEETLTVHVVAWERGEREVLRGNKTVDRPAAVNQTAVTQQVNLGRGYDEATIRLPSSFDTTETVTMWVEEYPDARWKFQHRSIPSTQQVDIGSKGGVWKWAVVNVFLPALLAIIISLALAKWTLREAFTGPGWGLLIWSILTAIGGLAILSGLYFQISVVMAHLPWMLGALLGPVAYGGALLMGEDKVKVQLLKPHLSTPRSNPHRNLDGDKEPLADGGVVAEASEADARTNGHAQDDAHATGSPLQEIRELLLASVGHLPAKRGPDGRIGVPKTGVRPFLARLFADPAILDKEDLMTKIEVEELELDLPTTGIDEMILLDPESEGVDHRAAHLERRWPVWHRIDPEEADWSSKAMGMLGAVGLTFGLPAAGYGIGAEVGVPVLAGAVACLPALIEGYTAKDGEIDYEPANQHFQRAYATLIDLQRAQADGKTVEEAVEQADRERTRTAKEAIERSEQRNKVLSEEMAEFMSGMALDEESLDKGEYTPPDAGGGEDDE